MEIQMEYLTYDHQSLVRNIKRIAILLMDKPNYDMVTIAKCLDIIAPELINRTAHEVNPLIETVRFINKKIYRELHHAKRVSDYCEWFANTINCSHEQIYKVKSAGFIHDIGKMMVDEKVLGKLEKLTDKEFEYIKKHPGEGASLIKYSHRYREISQLIFEHHERWDGLGYPRGLRENQIIKEARMIAICDAYDAMTNDRIYRDAIGKDKAIDEINRCTGTQFDPILAKIFVENIKYCEVIHAK